MQSGERKTTAYPNIRFDQAVFDLRHGDKSFPLAEYYRPRFSPNLGGMAHECDPETNAPCADESGSEAPTPHLD